MLWSIGDEVMEKVEEGEDYDYSIYLTKLSEFGFPNTDKYKTDFNDDKWLDIQ